MSMARRQEAELNSGNVFARREPSYFLNTDTKQNRIRKPSCFCSGLLCNMKANTFVFKLSKTFTNFLFHKLFTAVLLFF